MAEVQSVTINGADLQYLQLITRGVLEGQYGPVSAVRATVDTNGQLVLSTNGYHSNPIGRPEITAPRHTTGTVPMPEGSGNPYANVPQEDSDDPVVLSEYVRRLEELERKVSTVITNAERLTGVRLQ